MIFAASSETTNSYTQSLMLFSLLYQNYQEKIYNEILNTIPENEIVSLTYRKK